MEAPSLDLSYGPPRFKWPLQYVQIHQTQDCYHQNPLPHPHFPQAMSGKLTSGRIVEGEGWGTHYSDHVPSLMRDSLHYPLAHLTYPFPSENPVYLTHCHLERTGPHETHDSHQSWISLHPWLLYSKTDPRNPLLFVKHVDALIRASMAAKQHNSLTLILARTKKNHQHAQCQLRKQQDKVGAVNSLSLIKSAYSSSGLWMSIVSEPSDINT